MPSLASSSLASSSARDPRPQQASQARPRTSTPLPLSRHGVGAGYGSNVGSRGTPAQDTRVLGPCLYCRGFRVDMCLVWGDLLAKGDCPQEVVPPPQHRAPGHSHCSTLHHSPSQRQLHKRLCSQSKAGTTSLFQALRWAGVGGETVGREAWAGRPLRLQPMTSQRRVQAQGLVAPPPQLCLHPCSQGQ